MLYSRDWTNTGFAFIFLNVNLSYRARTLLFIELSLTVKAATFKFRSGCDSAVSSAKEGKSGSLYNLVMN